MYSIDANEFMNGAIVLILGTAALLLGITLAYAIATGKRGGPVLSYLYMLTGIFGTFSVAVCVLGFRGQKSENRPWHFFLDMKYQAKYTSQGQSRFFADGRSDRLPVENAIPFDGTDYFADAGYHESPNPDFLKEDLRYYYGIANRNAKSNDKDGVEMLAKPEWKDGKLVGEGYYVNRIPEKAVAIAGGWEALIERGHYQFNVNCSVCHGTSGRGGASDAAYGVLGAYGLSVAPSNQMTPEIQAQPDGQLYNTIAYGVRVMPAYGHQVKVQDRWAIVAYLRVLQYAAGNPAFDKK